MYDGVVTIIRSPESETSDFLVTIGLHPGLALSLHLFALVMVLMDELTRHVQDVSWYMLFTDDIVLVDKTKRVVNTKFEFYGRI